VAETRAPGSGAETIVARAATLCDAALAGDRRSLARLLTAVENRTPLAEAALRRLYPLAGKAQLIGITGPPGAGKSTLVAALIAELRRAGRPVAVVAVDPSSPITGGAVLGDRVRMQAYSTDDGVFIRSMASRGHSGGLSSSTAAAAAVLDAAGFDVVLIETVGTGQSEVEVAATADTTVVVEAPEMGDEIQAIKAGLLEVADIIVVNKGDRPGAHRTAGQLHAMLADAPRDVRPGQPAPKNPDVLVTTAATGDGVAELLAAIDRHRAIARGSIGFDARFKRAEAQVWAVLVDRLHQRVRALEGAVDDASGLGDHSPRAAAGSGVAAGELLLAVAAHEMDPFDAADELLAMLTGGAGGELGGPVDAGSSGRPGRPGDRPGRPQA
jgi:LAO/AO transport system kinase